MKKTFVTLLSTDNYLKGVLVLYQSLKNTNTPYPLVVLLSERISDNTEQILRQNNIKTIRIVNPVNMEITSNINKTGSTHWNYTFEKLYIFRLTQFEKIVYLDSDMLVLENIDELFEKEHMSAVGPAGGKFPGNESYNGLNSGLLVIKPDAKVFEILISLIPSVTKKLEKCGDQDVIIEHFIEKWRNNKNLHLDDKYNMIFPYSDFYIKNFNYTLNQRLSQKNIKIMHFIGAEKPWMRKHNLVSFAKFSAYLLKNIICKHDPDRLYQGKAMLIYKRYLLKIKAAS